MLGSQALSEYELTIQTIFYIYFLIRKIRKKIYLRTCHTTLECDNVLFSFSKAHIRYSKIKSKQKSKTDLPSTFISPEAIPPLKALKTP